MKIWYGNKRRQFIYLFLPGDVFGACHEMEYYISGSTFDHMSIVVGVVRYVRIHTDHCGFIMVRGGWV